MSFLSKALHDRPMLRGALIAPSLIALIFSLFNLSAPPDPARIAPLVNVATVNLDTGLPFPPINIADRLIGGLATRLPTGLRSFDTEAAARAALQAEEVAAILVFPADFSRAVAGSDPVPVSVITSGSVTMVESQMAGALPAMVETGIATAVQTFRLAMAQGRLPDMTSPVAVSAEVIHPVTNAATRAAPFVAGFVLGLIALVGALVGSLGTRGLAPRRAALLQAGLPVVAMPVAAAVLTALVYGFAGGDALALWLAVSGLALAFAWLFSGALAVLGPVALLAIVPLVFWQGVLGGTQMPAAGAPDWLHWLLPLGMDRIGGYLRSILLGGDNAFPVALALGAAGLGLALIGLRAVVARSAH